MTGARPGVPMCGISAGGKVECFWDCELGKIPYFFLLSTTECQEDVSSSVGQREIEYGLVHHVQGEHYQRHN